jgi:hypothetical protein
MTSSAEQFQQSDDGNRLNALWKDAAVPENPPPAQTAAQALAFGVNFRVNLLKAFQAAWETAQIAIKLTVATHTFDPLSALEIGVEVVSAVHTIFSSLVQGMRPIDYITAVILSNSEELTGADLRKAVEDFLRNPNASQFSWYLGMSEDRVRRAREVAAMTTWFDQTLDRLREADFLLEQNQIMRFKPHHYTVGWKEG